MEQKTKERLEALIRSGSPGEALRSVKELISDEPRDLEVWLFRAEALMHLGCDEQAAAAIRCAMQVEQPDFSGFESLYEDGLRERVLPASGQEPKTNDSVLPECTEALCALLDMVAAKDYRARLAANELTFRLPSAGWMIPILEKRSLDSDDLVRAACVRLLGACRDSPPTALAAALDDSRSSVRAAAAEALGKKGSAEDIAKLERLFQDPDIDVAEAAIWAVVQIGGDEAAQALLRAGNSRNSAHLAKVYSAACCRLAHPRLAALIINAARNELTGLNALGAIEKLLTGHREALGEVDLRQIARLPEKLSVIANPWDIYDYRELYCAEYVHFDCSTLRRLAKDELLRRGLPLE